MEPLEGRLGGCGAGFVGGGTLCGLFNWVRGEKRCVVQGPGPCPDGGGWLWARPVTIAIAQ